MSRALCRSARGWLAGALLLAAPLAALGDENADLERIPESIQSPQPAAESAAASERPADLSWRMFVENSVSGFSYRSDLAVPPPTGGLSEPAWQEWLALDSRGEHVLGGGWRIVHSARYNLFAEDTIVFPSEQTERLDLRELYASWEAMPRSYLDAGRINVKNGVAVGFNPTDFFKTRAVVDFTSQDPTVLRENRLGAGIVRGQSLWDGGSVSLAFAPQLNPPSSIYNLNRLPSFDPMLDRTNGQQRTLLTASFELPGDLSTQVLAYQAGTRTQAGLNLTLGLGRQVVAYAEWSGGDRGSLITEALAYGKETKTLPSATPRVLPGSSAIAFHQDVAAGASYTTAFKLSVYLEYDYHEAGFTKRDWQNWFAVGQRLRNVPQVAGELWYIREYAADQGEPMAQQSIFVRASWTDAFVRDLELDGIAEISQVDDSALYQATATYFLSNRWTVGALALLNDGSQRSERGSLPEESSLLLKLTRYL